MHRIKIVSFDLEGTLVGTDFSRLVWEEALPALYAEEKGISLKDALKQIMEEYAKIGPERIEWYDLRYWFRRFRLQADWRGLLERFKDSVETYPEVRSVLDRLSRDFKLIIISNTSRDFMDYQMRKLNACVARIFSATTDYGTVKSPELYVKICSEMGVNPQQVVLLDRSIKERGEYIIRDLEEFELRLLELCDLAS